MKKINKHVVDTREQITNTLQFLYHTGLARITKDVLVIPDQDFEVLTWKNHVPGRHNAGKSFTRLNQYMSIYETGAYHCILYDGSIIRVFFKFHRNILREESLLYWPAPIEIPEDEIEELGIREAISMYMSDVDLRNGHLLMRSPCRLDYDSFNVNALHPETHLHIQNEECRISVRKPICFNTFIKFIFKNFYPNKYRKDLDKLDQMNYSGGNIYEKAVVCL